MKKIVIPTILAATILVAGMFAMMPVQKASTIHSTFGGSVTTNVTPVVNEKDGSYVATIAGAATNIVVAAEALKTIRGQAVIAETSGTAATTCALQDTGGTVLIAAVGPGASGVVFIDSGANTPAGFSAGEGLQIVSVTAGVRCALSVNLDSTSG